MTTDPTATNDTSPLDRRCIDTLRTLAIDAVEQAQSGHPGTPMGAAPIAYTLWQRFLRFDPQDTTWPDRDRFVLSGGHASALLYGLLHLCGVRDAAGAEAVSMDDLQRFRQLGSHCTGHPEHGVTAGVETTTGPLGQGIATSVGQAIAQAWLAATYNRPDHRLFDHRVYALCGDGDLMEGLSAEAASLAGHLQLAHLCWLYDCNRISIEGSTTIAFTEDVGARFAAQGWQVLRVAAANDLGALTRALQTFVETTDRPTLIIVQSTIGYGAPHKADTKEAHGEPLGAEEVRLTKRFYGVDPDASFVVPEGVLAHFAAKFGQRGAQAHGAWTERFAAYRARYPTLALQLDQMQHRTLPPGWDAHWPTFAADARGLATREASGQVLNVIAARVPWLIGGAADLGPSTKTRLGDHAGDFEPPGGGGGAGDYQGRNLHFGVREHAMCAISNGLALSGLRPFAASFLVFSDYGRGAIRLSAVMGLPVLYLWTHDSIAMGEDGPTHKPVEQLAALRALPGMVVLRPADANEVAEAWRVAMQCTDRPVSLVLSRQALPTLDRTRYGSARGVARGAYVLADPSDGRAPEVLLIGTGSEVALCLAACEQFGAEGIAARVVSMPSWDLFEAQSADYRDRVLPPELLARVAVEAASPLGWERHVGADGAVIGMTGFGHSAPGAVVQAACGFDVAHVVAAAHEQLLWHPGLTARTA